MHEMLKPVLWENKKNISIDCFLKFLHRALRFCMQATGNNFSRDILKEFSCFLQKTEF